MIAKLMIKGRKLVDILAVPTWRRALLIHGVAGGTEHRFVLQQCGEVRAAVDIGANRGQFALIARHCFPNAQVLSFEPLLGPAMTFRKIFSEIPEVILHQVAIGPDSGEATIHLSKRDDSSSLLPITELQDRYFPGTAETGTANIKIGPLASFVSAAQIRSPALLKIDVQGFELQTLQSCVELLDRFTYVYVECSFKELYQGQALADEVVAWLSKHSFRLSGVYNTSYDRAGEAIQADFLFRRR